MYDFISVIHKENGGLSKLGIRVFLRPKENMFIFLDSDDWLNPDNFIALAEALESQEFIISLIVSL